GCVLSPNPGSRPLLLTLRLEYVIFLFWTRVARIYSQIAVASYSAAIAWWNGEDLLSLPRSGIALEMHRVSSREAYMEPATKHMSGPKLQAAGAPRKCSPGIEASSPRFSRG